MAARDGLEVVDKSVVDGSSSERAYDRNSLRGGLLRNDKPEAGCDLSNQPHEHRATFLNDAAFSNEAGGFRDGSRENPTRNEIATLRSVIGLSPTAQSKDFNARQA